MCNLGLGSKVDNAKPEVLLAKAFADELGVDIHPQALRMFIRSRWTRVSALAHNINGCSATQPDLTADLLEAVKELLATHPAAYGTPNSIENRTDNAIRIAREVVARAESV